MTSLNRREASRPSGDPLCPYCGADESRRVRNYGRPVGNEWMCCVAVCHRRWDEDARPAPPSPRRTLECDPVCICGLEELDSTCPEHGHGSPMRSRLRAAHSECAATSTNKGEST